MKILSPYHTENSSGSYGAARVISDIANPLVVPLFVFSIIGLIENLPAGELGVLLGIALVFHTLVPGAAALNLSGRLPSGSLDFPVRGSRTTLYGYSLLSTFLGSILVLGLIHNPIVRLTAVIFFMTLFCSFIINFSLKVSVHTASLATGGACLLFVGLVSPPAFPSLILGTFTLGIMLPLMIWARYHLNVHTVLELLGGTGMGFMLTGLLFYLFFFSG